MFPADPPRLSPRRWPQHKMPGAGLAGRSAPLGAHHGGSARPRSLRQPPAPGQAPQVPPRWGGGGALGPLKRSGVEGHGDPLGNPVAP